MTLKKKSIFKKKIRVDKVIMAQEYRAITGQVLKVGNVY